MTLLLLWLWLLVLTRGSRDEDASASCDALIAVGELEGGAACLRALITAEEDAGVTTAHLHNNLGNALMQQGRVAAACDAYERAATPVPAASARGGGGDGGDGGGRGAVGEFVLLAALTNLASCREARGDLAGAARLLDRATASDGDRGGGGSDDGAPDVGASLLKVIRI